MLYLVFSDLHGNLPALEKVIANEKVDGYINLGDVVNYAPWNNECVELINGLPNCVNLRGNHETYFIKGESGSKHPLVKLFFDACYSSFKMNETIKNYEESINYCMCSCGPR